MSSISTSYHSHLANYFQSKPLYLDAFTHNKLNIRKLAEQPWQQIKCGNFVELEKTLVDVEIFLALSNRDRFEIWRYWQSMPSERSEFVPGYLKEIERWRENLGKTERFELALNELSHFFYVSEKKDDSFKLTEEVLHLAESLYNKGDIRLAIRQNNLGACYAYKQDWNKAMELFESARPVYIKELGLNNSDTWILQEGIAVCLIHTKRVNEGIEELQKCLQFNRKHSGNNSYATAVSMYNLADAYTNHDKLDQVISMFQEALYIYEKKLGIDHPQTIDCKVRLEDWLKLSELQKKSVELEQDQNFSESLKVFIQLENLCAELSTKPFMANCLYGQARALRVLGIEFEAISKAKMALHFAEDSNEKLIEPLQAFLKAKPNVNLGGIKKKSLSVADNLTESYMNAVPEFGDKSSNEFLRRLALYRFEMGDYYTTEKLLNRLLNTGFEVASTHIHLARLFLITDQITKCVDQINQGWEMKSGAKPYIIARLLWFKITLAFINGELFQNLLGQLKNVLQKEDAVMEWTMQQILVHIKSKITDEQYDLLSTLVDAMSYEEKLNELETIEMWRNIVPQPLIKS